MSRIFSITLICAAFIIGIQACHQDKNVHKEIIKSFYKGLNTGEFSRVADCVTESITLSEKQFIIAQSSDDLYRMFQWDSVFQPDFTIKEINQSDTGTFVIVSKICKRIAYLQDSALIYKVKVEFDENKISSMKTIDYLSVNFGVWKPRRDTLSMWISENHPELDGFVRDMTPTGAQKYLEAIELYESAH